MMLLLETLHQLRLFSRRPAAVFFVTVLPVLLLVIFTEIFGNDPLPGQTVTTAQFYTPALAVFALPGQDDLVSRESRSRATCPAMSGGLGHTHHAAVDILG